MTTEQKIQEMLDRDKRNPRQSEFERDSFLDLIPKIECADGFTMSVQTGKTHYCHPRDSYGPWFAVEVGFPSEKVEEFMEYIDGKESDPTDTVYGYVPLSTVAAVIDSHGGFAA